MGAGAGGDGGLEHALRQVTPGGFDAYETLLGALADGEVWMLLWQGTPGGADAQYGNMEVGGLGYAPCVTSSRELAASGWTRAHEVVSGREVAASLFPDRWGLWLNPHAPGGGVGVPWLDLRRIGLGLDQAPAGPLRIAEPALQIPQYYALLSQQAHRTPSVRSLRRAWVQPVLGEPYLAIGVDLYDAGPQSAETVRQMMQSALPAVPQGLPVAAVALADEYDPVGMWMRSAAQPFYDRDAHVGGGGAGAVQGGWAPQRY
ncbi:enhanced serine sensitivity protein SseB C-terminal domain-containing protein [Streptomyces sp. NPDC046977]|uniref:enhanced serine sensitivity protein SseB C-terminal domain-containing protein n=1 Tax=Streptomyces sp. NPDC046977 TaxID=3154703 RepID=UPI0034096455